MNKYKYSELQISASAPYRRYYKNEYLVISISSSLGMVIRAVVKVGIQLGDGTECKAYFLLSEGMNYVTTRVEFRKAGAGIIMMKKSL
jgi:hypothetical protein